MVRVKRFLPLKKLVWLHFIQISCTLLLCSSLVGAVGAESTAPLLLSLDVEKESDVESLKKINLQEPATYFVTGAFALQFPEVVAELAKQGTIGSHSHSHPYLTQLSHQEVRADLLASVEAIQSATGQAPVWFRAPYLDLNDAVLTVAHAIGFRHDSSEPERWAQQHVLSEFPISINATGRILFSDYDIFHTFSLDRDMALNMLKENYLNRLRTGRPFVLLLHPDIIVHYTEVLHKFIAFVKQQGGNCLSFDQYRQQLLAESAVRIGVRIDLSTSKIDPQRTISELQSAHVTDVFLLVRDRTGKTYYRTDSSQKETTKLLLSKLIHGLSNAGIRVHAWLPVLRNAESLKQAPERAMLDANSQRSTEWLSPSHPQTINDTEQTIIELLTTHPFDGIHLDDIAYPSLEYDFSKRAIRKLIEEAGLPIEGKNAAKTLPEDHYNEWIQWRSAQISNIVKTARRAIDKARPEALLSAALDPVALVDFQGMENSGQDYGLLAKDLDIIITTPPADASPPPSQIISLSRFMIGNTALFVGLPDTSEGNGASIAADQLNTTDLTTIRHGADGIVFSVSPFLPDQSELKQKQHAEFINAINVLRQPAPPSPSRRSPENAEKPDALWKKASIDPAARSSIALLAGCTTGVAFFAFIGYRSFRRRHIVEKPTPKKKEKLRLEWRSMEQSINAEQICGQLVCAVAEELRSYDPVSISKYRIALILAIVADAPQPLSINELLAMDQGITGWHILGISHLKDALAHGFLKMNDEHLQLTHKGRHHLHAIKKEGFDQKKWFFVEKRLHENLIASCPNCGEANLAHWYWTTFFCSKCGREVNIQDCSAVSRNTSATIALDQHHFA